MTKNVKLDAISVGE